MKRTLLFLMSLLFVAAISCNKSRQCYSCDTDVDDFVIKNEKELSTISINKLAEYKPEIQRATFRIYDEQQKQNIWEEKFKYILKNNPNNYTNEELNAVKEVLNYAVEHGVEGDHSNFLNNWVLEVREKFLWGDDRIRFLIMSLEVNENHYFKNYNVINASVKSDFCHCSRLNNGIIMKDCSSLEGDCKTQGVQCQAKPQGCGYLFAERCDGKCSGLTVPDVIDPVE